MTRLRPMPLLLALASGFSLALAFPPYRLPLLGWISLAILIETTLGARPWMAALCGLLHGFAFYGFSLPWIYTVMRVHGGLGPPAAAGVFGLMVLALALFPAAFTLVVAHLAKASIARACFAAPFLWVVTELARTHLPELGFPWNLLGYAVSDHLGLVQVAAFAGIYALSFLVAAYNAVLVWAWESLRVGGLRPFVVWLGVSATLLLVVFFGSRFVPEPQAHQTAYLVQPNFPQTTGYEANWIELHAAELGELEALSVAGAQARPGLIVWPEVPAPLYLLDPQFAARAERIARASRSHFLLGIADWKPARPGVARTTEERFIGPFNSAALLDPTGQRVFSYDKIHLVPFGEYVPWRRWLAFAEELTAEVGGFRAGTEYTLGQLTASPAQAVGRDSGKFGVFICFEAVFPGEVRRFVAAGAELLINISNDGWFGRSSAPEQHLAMARVRAVENRRWLLRATNNGYTVAVDPYGRIVARLEPDRRGVLAAPYDFRGDHTLYARWGDWWAWLSLAVTALALLPGKRKK